MEARVFLLLATICLIFTIQATPALTGVITSGDDRTDFTFEDIFDSNFTAKYYHGSWNNDTLIYQDGEGNLLLIDPDTEVTELLLEANISLEHKFMIHVLSPDGRFLLLGSGYQKNWRYSFTAKYTIYDREKEGTDEAFIRFPNSADMTNSSLQYAGWSPVGQHLVFVHDNDLYFQESPFRAPIRVTYTGEEFIYNGVPDWLYEEDVLSSARAVYWSPDAKHLLFATFNDTQVPLIEFPMYGPSSDIYGTTKKIPYPKAGDITSDGKLGPNPTVTLHIFSVTSRTLKDIQPPAKLVNQDHYYLGVNWADNDKVMITWANRAINESLFSLCNAIRAECTEVREEKYPKGWIRGPVLRFWFIDDGASYITEARKEEGSSGTWVQVALMSTQGGGDPIFLTGGEAEVIGVLGVDEVKRVIYYSSTNGDPKQRHIFRVGLPDAEQAFSSPVCLTCGDESCSYNGATFSRSATYYIRRCRGPGVPTDSIIRLSDNEVRRIENNTGLQEAIDRKNLPRREFHLVDVGGGYKAQAELFLPPGFSKDKKYPLLISTYGGPGSQEVLDTFPLGGSISKWLAQLGSAHDVIVASVDGRGAGGRGDRYMYELWRRMGTVEVEDQAAAARYFKNLPYVDESKPVAIYGWSYGGEVSSQAIADYPVFGCAIAVAPVTSKRYYDTAYTERVMGFDLESDNQKGYNNTDITEKAANFTGKKYMLAHGTADDNVHFMNSAQLVKALVEAEVQFKFRMYVDEAHGIRAHPSSFKHLLQSMNDFLLDDCWDISRVSPRTLNSANHNKVNSVMLLISLCFALKCLFW